MTWTRKSFFWILLLCLLQGCGIYSFSGLSLPPEAKTFSMNFQSEVALGPADLSDQFQQKLGEELKRHTLLKQVDIQGDLQLEGTIKKFKYLPIAPRRISNQEEKARLERLTIEVQMSYINPYDKESAFSKETFSEHADMPADAERASKQPALINEIFTKIISKILARIDNW